MGFAYTYIQDTGGGILSGLFEIFQTNPAPIVNRAAPDFVLNDLSGTPVRLSSLKGRPIVINFWATWCGPCQSEMPLIEKTAEKYPNLTILAVNDDEAVSDVNSFVKRFGLSFPILMDPGAAVNIQYQVTGLPTSFFVDENGIIRSLQIGVLSEEQLKDHLHKIGLR